MKGREKKRERYRKREGREKQQEEEAEAASSEDQTEREKEAEISLPPGKGAIGSGWSLFLKGTGYPGNRAGQHNYSSLYIMTFHIL